MMTYANAILLVMQNPREGQDSAHRDWYLAHHLPDVCGVPGVLRGEFAGTTDRLEGLRWTNAAAYWLDGDPAAILGEIFQRAGSGDWTMSDTLDGESMMMAVGQALTGRVRSTVTVDAAGKERRSEEQTSELQSLMSRSYAVFCLKKKKKKRQDDKLDIVRLNNTTTQPIFDTDKYTQLDNQPEQREDSERLITTGPTQNSTLRTIQHNDNSEQHSVKLNRSK